MLSHISKLINRFLICVFIYLGDFCSPLTFGVINKTLIESSILINSNALSQKGKTSRERRLGNEIQTSIVSEIEKVSP